MVSDSGIRWRQMRADRCSFQNQPDVIFYNHQNTSVKKKGWEWRQLFSAKAQITRSYRAVSMFCFASGSRSDHCKWAERVNRSARVTTRLSWWFGDVVVAARQTKSPCRESQRPHRTSLTNIHLTVPKDISDIRLPAEHPERRGLRAASMASEVALSTCNNLLWHAITWALQAGLCRAMRYCSTILKCLWYNTTCVVYVYIYIEAGCPKSFDIILQAIPVKITSDFHRMYRTRSRFYIQCFNFVPFSGWATNWTLVKLVP